MTGDSDAVSPAYLKQLVEIGVLEEMTTGREKLYLNTRLLQELND